MCVPARLAGPQCIVRVGGPISVLAGNGGPVFPTARHIARKKQPRSRNGDPARRSTDESHDGVQTVSALSDPGGEQEYVPLALTSAAVGESTDRACTVASIRLRKRPLAGESAGDRTLLRLRRIPCSSCTERNEALSMRTGREDAMRWPGSTTWYRPSEFPLPHSPAVRSPNLGDSRVQPLDHRRRDPCSVPVVTSSLKPFECLVYFGVSLIAPTLQKQQATTLRGICPSVRTGPVISDEAMPSFHVRWGDGHPDAVLQRIVDHVEPPVLSDRTMRARIGRSRPGAPFRQIRRPPACLFEGR